MYRRSLKSKVIVKLFGRLHQRLGKMLESHYFQAPLVTKPLANQNTYLKIATDTKALSFPEVNAFEEKKGVAVDKEWLDQLALHTQVILKKSAINYQHGRILYTALRDYISTTEAADINIFETGSGRGFSAVVMAKAMLNANINGRIITLDVLPHKTPIYWNCIDDHEGKKNRSQLLAGFEECLNHIVFLHGDIQDMLPRVGMQRIHFAFLDAAHTYKDVLNEFSAICNYQRPGDMIAFDDYSPEVFPGVVKAVDEIEATHGYTCERIVLSDGRGYAVAVKK